MPAESPAASISFTAGYTRIEITYNSPAVRERKVWGGLVPWGQPWKESATISFSTDINIEGTMLEKGEYALFLIPKKGDEWVAVFDSDTGLQDFRNDDRTTEIARIKIPVKFVDTSKDRLSYEIVDQNPEQGYIKMAWEKARAYLRFRIQVVEEAMEQVDAALEHADPGQQWMILARGAEFLLNTGRQMKQALYWADESTDLRETSYNWWVKARILAHEEMYPEAIGAGKKAIEFGTRDLQDEYYRLNQEQIQGLMQFWVSEVNGTAPGK